MIKTLTHLFFSFIIYTTSFNGIGDLKNLSVLHFPSIIFNQAHAKEFDVENCKDVLKDASICSEILPTTTASKMKTMIKVIVKKQQLNPSMGCSVKI